jgi:thioredoxin 1
MSNIFHIEDEADFLQHLSAAGDLLVVVDFFATWCGPCKNIEPKLEILAEKFSGKIMILKIDTDKCRELKLKHGIRYVPTFIFFWNGERLDGVVDEANSKKVEVLIEKYLASTTC